MCHILMFTSLDLVATYVTKWANSELVTERLDVIGSTSDVNKRAESLTVFNLTSNSLK